MAEIFWDKLQWNQTATQTLDVTNPLFLLCLTKETNYAFCHNWIGARLPLFTCLNKHSGAENAYVAGLTTCSDKWCMWFGVKMECERAWLSAPRSERDVEVVRFSATRLGTWNPKWFGRKKHFHTWYQERLKKAKVFSRSVCNSNSRCWVFTWKLITAIITGA